MATITVYTLQDADGDDLGTFETMNFEEAKAEAREQGARVIANEYEWTEAVPVEGADFTVADQDDEEQNDE